MKPVEYRSVCGFLQGGFQQLVVIPSRGEKPPFMMSSRSHSCRSVRTMAGSFSASAASSSRRGASRATRSLRMPPWGGFAMITERGGGSGGHETRGKSSCVRSNWDKVRDGRGRGKTVIEEIRGRRKVVRARLGLLLGELCSNRERNNKMAQEWAHAWAKKLCG